MHSPGDPLRLVDVKEAGRETTLCLAAAHALVLLDDGTVVGDPMEKMTLEALNRVLSQAAPRARLWLRCAVCGAGY